MKVLHETDVSIAFDGGNNVGMLALYYAAETTIRKAAGHGIAITTTQLVERIKATPRQAGVDEIRISS
jgi:LDH2 family malate/lactate/ureidoglycolate dehydrogenase